MATRKELKNIALARLKTVQVLITAQDWDYAGYTLGYVMEFALKAAICKRLNLSSYPADDNSKSREVRGLFKTHSFDSLLTLSGLSKDFGPNGDPLLFQSWSEATQDYMTQINWVDLRYKPGFWDKSKVDRVFLSLTDPTRGILIHIKKKRKW